MKVTAYKTNIITAGSSDILDILAAALPCVPENSVIAITSKVVSLCEGSVKPGAEDRDELIEGEADLFLPKADNRYNVYLTIKNNMMIPNAGMDESNADGNFILWPRDPTASAERCWRFIRERYQVQNCGVIITDSTTTPLKWGVTGTCIGYCGFAPVNSHVGRKDLFGRSLKMTRVNVADALAAAAVLCMGETDEQTPLALAEELPFVRFLQEPPTQEQIQATHISLEDDLFGQLLTPAPWKTGGKHKKTQ